MASTANRAHRAKTAAEWRPPRAGQVTKRRKPPFQWGSAAGHPKGAAQRQTFSPSRKPQAEFTSAEEERGPPSARQRRRWEREQAAAGQEVTKGGSLLSGMRTPLSGWAVR